MGWLSEFRKYKVWVISIILILIVAIFLTYSYITPNGIFSNVSNDLTAIEPTETQSYTDLNGNLVDLASFKGTPLVVNSWATWIPFSQQELPLLISIQKEYGDTVKVLAVNRMEYVGTVRAFLSIYAIPEEMTFLLDPGDTFYKAIGGTAMPETVFYDAYGNKVGHVKGVLDEETLRNNLLQILR